MAEEERQPEIKKVSGDRLDLGIPLEKVGPLLDKESEVVKKIWKRNKGCRELLDNTQHLFRDLIEIQAFKNAILQIQEERSPFYLWNPSIIQKLVNFIISAGPMDHKTEGILRDKLQLLYKNLSKLNRMYRAAIYVKKDGDGEISIEPEYAFPQYALFRVKGAQIEDASTESAEHIKNFYERIFQFGRLFNEIEIEDSPVGPGQEGASDSQLHQILVETPETSPTIIKYTMLDEMKRMLICLPPDVDPTTFSKEYGTIISNVHRDFYKTKFKGRPESKTQIKKYILAIWEKEFKKKSYSIDKKCKMASEILKRDHKIELGPLTIKRHYKDAVKGKADHAIKN